jgi:UDP-glucuronate 4-epimerase
VIHLAAQPGIRYSLQNPHVYVQSNIVGFVNLLEHFRRSKAGELRLRILELRIRRQHQAALAEADRVDTPVSLYAATKKQRAHSPRLRRVCSEFR